MLITVICYRPCYLSDGKQDLYFDSRELFTETSPNFLFTDTMIILKVPPYMFAPQSTAKGIKVLYRDF